MRHMGGHGGIGHAGAEDEKFTRLIVERYRKKQILPPTIDRSESLKLRRHRMVSRQQAGRRQRRKRELLQSEIDRDQIGSENISADDAVRLVLEWRIAHPDGTVAKFQRANVHLIDVY